MNHSLFHRFHRFHFSHLSLFLKISPMFQFLSLARLSLAAFLITPCLVSAQTTNYPTKPVRVILPFPPGGSTSIVARIFQQKFTESWGQSIIVDNRPGGNTIIGSEAMVRAPADGYTLLGVTSTHIINPWLQPKLPYDTFKDFAAVSTLTRADFMMATSPSFPPNTLKEFIDYAKSNPGKINSVTVGLGTVQHLVIELFMDASGTKFTVVPYKGGGPANTDLIAGVVQVTFNNPGSLSSFVRAGKMKGIAISGERRKASLPEVPTFAEAGLPGFSAVNWMAMLAPAATPKDIIQKINVEISKAQNSKEVIDQITNQAIEPFPNTVAATEALIRTDYERYGKIIREKNIKADTD